MNILVVSDTHGRADRLTEALDRTRPGVLLFLGDGLRDLARIEPGTVTVRAVRGNCDFYGAEIPATRMEIFGKYRIFLTHGHHFGVKSSIDPLVGVAAKEGADALLYGHTHIPFSTVLPAEEVYGGVRLVKSLAVLCPGSLGEPRGGVPTFGTLELRENGILPSLGEL